jgi:transposase
MFPVVPAWVPRPGWCRRGGGGDRQLNGALHTIVMIRERYHEPTRRYVTRRTAEGKSDREIRHCLKRTVARQLFRLLERSCAEAR